VAWCIDAPGFGVLTSATNQAKETKMAFYVDGFVIPVPTKNLAAYRKMATLGAKVWMDHGAVSYVECVADDVKPGKVTSFPQAVKLKDGETVVFSWITFKSRPRQREGDERSAHADAAEGYALRRDAHVLRRLQDDGDALRNGA
jgi:uncharacterized protein YbaA (DUF1428 family)